ncbi:MAG: hypothetical protein D6808_00130 [Candidatus Dadabacteria bacterium]|nr:MAG: hypothetical protein D6808_00130 [Candidatus Dadabacteria bacterium]
MAKYKKAVGLEYDQNGDRAPLVNLKGEALLAEHIVKIAHRYGVPVVENSELACALHKVELDEEIPKSLFEPIAIVLRHLKSVFR